MRRLLGALTLIGLAVCVAVAFGQGMGGKGTTGLKKSGGRSLGNPGVARSDFPQPKSYWFAAGHGLHNNEYDALGEEAVDGSVDSTNITLTISERIEIAENPPMMISAEGWGANLEYTLDQYKSHNPDFQWLLYFNYGHVDSTWAFNAAQRPFGTFKYNTLTPWRAKDLNGDDFVVWFASGDVPGTDPPSTYAVDYVTDTDPPAADTDRIDTYLEGWWYTYISSMQVKPQGVMVDYIFDPSTGYFWYEAVNDSLDLDGDGLAYQSDTNEQAAFKAAQQYYLDKIRALGGTNFLILANGRDSWPGDGDDADVLARLDGVYMEKYPTTEWASYQYGDALNALWVEQENHPYRRDEPVMLLDLFNDQQYGGEKAEDSRYSALMFDATFFPRIRNSVTPDSYKLNDTIWDDRVDSLGASLGEAFLQSGTAGHATDPYVFRRLFTNYYLDVTVDQDAASAFDRIQGEIKEYAAGSFNIASFAPVSGDSTRVSITFSANVDTNTASLEANYGVSPTGSSIPTLTITDAVPVTLSQVTLKVSPKLYEGLSMDFTAQNVETPGGDVLAPGSGATYIGRDVYPPAVASISQPDTSSYKLRVVFNDTLDVSGAITFGGYYTTESGLTGDSVTKVDYRTVDVTWDGAMANLTSDSLYVNSAIEDDNDNPINGSTPWKFTTLDSRPFISSVQWADSNSCSVVFNEEMLASAAEDTSNWDISPALGFTSASASGSVVTLNFETSFTALQSYLVTGLSGLEDLEGNPIGSPDNDSFDAFDVYPPALVSITQSDSNTATVTFSEAVTAASSTDSTNYTISPSVFFDQTTPAVQDTVNIVQLNFASNLSNGQLYTITVDNVVDDFGNQMAASAQDTFTATTQGGGPSGGPTLVWAGQVSALWNLGVEFNVAMNASTVDVTNGSTECTLQRWDGSAYDLIWYADNLQPDTGTPSADNTVGFRDFIGNAPPASQNMTDDDWYLVGFSPNTVEALDGTTQPDSIYYIFKLGTPLESAPPEGEGAGYVSSGGGGATDTTPPDLLSASIPNLTTVNAVWNEGLDVTSAETVGNWKVNADGSPGSPLTIGSVSQSGFTSTLTMTDSLSYGTTYWVKAENVKDDSDNTQAAADSVSQASPSAPAPPSGDSVIDAVATAGSGDDTVYISGSGFGTVTLDLGPEGVGSGGWIETESNGTLLTSLSNGWDGDSASEGGDGVSPFVTSSVKRTGSQSIDATVDQVTNGAGNYNAIVAYEKSAEYDEVYASFWVMIDPQSIPDFAQWKFWYASGNNNHGACGSFTARYRLGNTTTWSDFASVYVDCANSSYAQCIQNITWNWSDQPGGYAYPDVVTRMNRGGLVSQSALLPVIGEWARFEVYLKASSDWGVEDGELEYYILRNGVREHIDTWGSFITHQNVSECKSYTTNPGWNFFSFLNYFDNNIGGFEEVVNLYFDDLYVQFGTKARVELGDASTFGACTVLEQQYPTSWSDTEVQVNLNTGLFSDGTTAYLYVVNDNGEASNGWPITIGEANGLSLQSGLGSAAEITSSDYAVSNTNTVETGKVTFVAGQYGNAMKITDNSSGEITSFDGENWDWQDTGQDGGRVDLWVRFDQDPTAYGNHWILHEGTGTRNINLEMTGSPSAPLFRLYSADGQDATKVPFGLFDYNPRNDSEWTSISSGEWHSFSLLWRNNGGSDKDELHYFIDGALVGSNFNGNLPVSGDADYTRIGYGDIPVTVDEVWSWDSWDAADIGEGDSPTIAWPDTVIQKYPPFDGFEGDPNLSVSDANITFKWSYFEADSTDARCIVYMNATAVDTVNNVSRLAHAESDAITAAGSITNGNNTWRCDCAGLTGPTWTFDYQGN